MHLVASRTPQEILRARLSDLLATRSAREVAQHARIPAAQLSRWKTGTLVPNPQLTTLARLARALGVAPAYLISDDAELLHARAAAERSLAERELEAAEQALRERREALRRLRQGS